MDLDTWLVFWVGIGRTSSRQMCNLLGAESWKQKDSRTKVQLKSLEGHYVLRLKCVQDLDTDLLESRGDCCGW